MATQPRIGGSRCGSGRDGARF